MSGKNKKQITPDHESLKIAFIYFVVSVIWIISSDFILIMLLSNDQYALYEVQAIKGVLFVLVTSTMIYLLANRSLKKIRDLDKNIKNKIDMLNLNEEVLKETRFDFIKQKSLIDNVISNTFIIILTLDLDCRITTANDYFYKLTEFEELDVIGKDINDFLSTNKNVDFSSSICEINIETPMDNIEVLLKCKNCESKYILLSISPTMDIEGNIKDHIVIGMDITKNKDLEETVHYLGYFDPITGLPNRHYLEDEFYNITNPLYNTKEDSIAFLYLDIDNFNQVNETFGHYAGDKLLVRIGEILQEEIGSKSLVGRISNNGFAVILRGSRCKDDANNRIIKLQESIKRPWEFNGEEFLISSTVGASMMTKDGQEFAILLKEASIAMEYCKKNNKGGFHHYTKSIEKEVLDDVSLLGDVRKAILNKEFTLNYQIVYDLRYDKIYGVEALIRWNHPQRGNIPPMNFIPLAETTNIIYDIRDFVVNEAIMQKKKWNDNGLDVGKIGMNISAKSFNKGDLAEIIEEKLKQYGINGNEIVLEITESGFIKNLNTVNDNVNKLSNLGIEVSLDDFGTGYSSLSRLKELKMNYIKLDRTFVMNIDKDGYLEQMVASVINLSKTIGLKVVAEGIETEAQFKILKDLGCDLGQGYYIHKPSSALELEELINR